MLLNNTRSKHNVVLVNLTIHITNIRSECVQFNTKCNGHHLMHFDSLYKQYTHTPLLRALSTHFKSLEVTEPDVSAYVTSPTDPVHRNHSPSH